MCLVENDQIFEFLIAYRSIVVHHFITKDNSYTIVTCIIFWETYYSYKWYSNKRVIRGTFIRGNDIHGKVAQSETSLLSITAQRSEASSESSIDIYMETLMNNIVESSEEISMRTLKKIFVVTGVKIFVATFVHTSVEIFMKTLDQ